MAYLFMILICLVHWVGNATAAHACSASYAFDRVAVPRTGATDVSTSTSIVVVARTEPFDLDLKRNGESVPIDGWTSLGPGRDEQTGLATYWRLRATLQPASTYLLSWATASADGGVSELTQFTTGAGEDETPGTAPNLRGLRLWRVHYPADAIAGGNCVFAEYHSFITVDYDPAVVPNTDPASVVHMFRLAPKTGGVDQTFVYTGADAFKGAAPVATYDYTPVLSSWQPELDPSREYCLTVDAFGDGDLARGTLSSTSVCAAVTELAAKGATGGGGGGGSVGGSGSGCTAAGGGSGAAALALISVLVSIATRRRRHGRRPASLRA